jgi:hypothetical protein
MACCQSASLRESVRRWGDENYVSIGRLLSGKGVLFLFPIGQTPKADFSVVSRRREKRRKTFAGDTKTKKKWDQ